MPRYAHFPQSLSDHLAHQGHKGKPKDSLKLGSVSLDGPTQPHPDLTSAFTTSPFNRKHRWLHVKTLGFTSPLQHQLSQSLDLGMLINTSIAWFLHLSAIQLFYKSILTPSPSLLADRNLLPCDPTSHNEERMGADGKPVWDSSSVVTPREREGNILLKQSNLTVLVNSLFSAPKTDIKPFALNHSLDEHFSSPMFSWSLKTEVLNFTVLWTHWIRAEITGEQPTLRTGTELYKCITQPVCA